MNATIDQGLEQSRVPRPAAHCDPLVIREVLQVTNGIESDRLSPVASRQAGLALQPLPLLGLVTYYYAAGILPSREIEQELWTNAAFRAVCGFEFPQWQVIRRFRRLNRPVIHDCLEQTLRRASHGANSHHRLSIFAENDFSDEADVRITNAILLDSQEDEP
jgi:transposase